MRGTLEIHEPAHLPRGRVPGTRPGARRPARYHSRSVELRAGHRAGDTPTLRAPPNAAAAPPLHHLLFLRDAEDVPGVVPCIEADAGPPAPSPS